MQESYVVAFESRKLKPHEKNYEMHDLELVVVIHTLKTWIHNLLVKKITLIKNQKFSLKYLFSQPDLNAG